MARSRSPAGLSLRSTTVHNTVYPGLLYSKNLVGPNMVRALSETKIAAFEDHETLARSVDQGRDDAEAILHTCSLYRIDDATQRCPFSGVLFGPGRRTFWPPSDKKRESQNAGSGERAALREDAACAGPGGRRPTPGHAAGLTVWPRSGRGVGHHHPDGQPRAEAFL